MATRQKPNINYRLLRELENSFREATITMEMLILSTPTSKRRNKLTEANIHMQEAISALREALDL